MHALKGMHSFWRRSNSVKGIQQCEHDQIASDTAMQRKSRVHATTLEQNCGIRRLGDQTHDSRTSVTYDGNL